MSRLHPIERAPLGRRDLLQLGLAAGLGLIGGCARGQVEPLLQAAPETLPPLWRRRLPRPWRFRPLEVPPASSRAALRIAPSADLLACGDGWLPAFLDEALQPVDAAPLQGRLGGQAGRFLDALGPLGAARVLPVGVSPWVMLLRGSEWLGGAAERGWDVLLDPGLRGQVVLPASPRMVVELADRLDQPESLGRLRRAALAFDDRQALNWLLQGRARVAVLPLQRCVPSLRRDPRLHAVLPRGGAPLHWTLLLRPATSREPLPQAWVEAAWQPPLLGQLLARGWRPPLPPSQLQAQARVIPGSLRSLVLPPQPVWERCWSLPPLDDAARAQLSRRWRQAAP
jgi:putative spermidine/putrescine transport system substrate-binding protein